MKDKQIKVRAAKALLCPYCKNSEYHPHLKNSLGQPYVLIRGYSRKDVQGRWWSHCLVCAGAYNKKLEPLAAGFSMTKGWFITTGGCVSSKDTKK